MASEGASGRETNGLLSGWYLLVGINALCRFYQLVASNGYRKWDSFGEVPSLAIQLAVRPLAPSVLWLRPKPPPSRREVFTEPFCKVTIPGAKRLPC